MEKNPIHLSEEAIIDILTLQYINNKKTDSAMEYVKLYQATRKEIEKYYKETRSPFDLNALVT